MNFEKAIDSIFPNIKLLKKLACESSIAAISVFDNNSFRNYYKKLSIELISLELSTFSWHSIVQNIIICLTILIPNSIEKLFHFLL